jgi:hypothetical protein
MSERDELTEIADVVNEVVSNRNLVRPELYPQQVALELSRLGYRKLSPADVARIRAEARAEGTREAATYIDLLSPPGLINKKAVLGDLEVAADRQQRMLYANGRARVTAVTGGEQEGESA